MEKCAVTAGASQALSLMGGCTDGPLVPDQSLAVLPRRDAEDWEIYVGYIGRHRTNRLSWLV
jgi:hypothetical protein